MNEAFITFLAFWNIRRSSGCEHGRERNRRKQWSRRWWYTYAKKWYQHFILYWLTVHGNVSHL